ncbi:response regulator transcription factor [Stenotrophomonas sp. 24(2023)]|uniref:response regulator transcription factor n=1 Tax=Stenotrophomonas sp. 24(2023) TaxID=3068324 RepID=UPI0027E0D214|nr:response regulator transcription factor [Stenotrophomonas sp. 24(2023)]WMJ71375.1 response regulator transcription factor [Stenotrophomonas sp. 24(2023)]
MSATPITPLRRRLALLDPHPVLRRGLEVVLCQQPGVQLQGSYGHGRGLLRALLRQPHDIDLLVVDVLPLDMPCDGMRFLRLLSRRWPALPILVLSAHCNASTVAMALEAGARGFLSKSAPAETLLRAVDVVVRGGRFVPAEMRAQLGRSRTQRWQHGLAPLSMREHEVVRLVLRGHRTSDMARTLGRAASTISTQKKSAYRKLGIRTDGDLFQIRHLLPAG